MRNYTIKNPFLVRFEHITAEASLFFVILCITSFSFAQTQKPSITTGVTFQWADTQGVNNDPATLSSITVNGQIYQSIVAPSSYTLTRLGAQGHSKNRLKENGIDLGIDSSDPTWTAKASAAFQDKNMNHYFTSSHNGQNICNNFSAITTTNAQIQSLHYTPGIPSNNGGILAISERNANNCYYISVYGIPASGGVEQFLGDTFVRPNSTQWGSVFAAPPVGVDYWNSGRVNENNGTIGIAIFSLGDIAPVGSVITRVDLIASTYDHGDGKFFILEKYAIDKKEKSCMNDTFSGTINGSTIVAGSTFSVLNGPSPAGQNFTFNTDGTYTYTPTVGFTGDVTFEYQVCLPVPNAGVCDTATVVITFESGPGTGCNCSSGNANAPLLQN